MLLRLSCLFESFVSGIDKFYIINQTPITYRLKPFYKRFLVDIGSKEDADEFDQFNIKRDIILKNAQNGWVSKAEIEFNQLQDSYQTKTRSEPIKLLMESQDFPLIAFIEYQKKQYSDAELSLKKGIEADWTLESKYGFREILYHRIHLIHNQAKVLLRKNELGAGITKLLKLMSQFSNPELNLFSPPIQFGSEAFPGEHASLLFHNIADSLSLICKESPDLYLSVINKSALITNQTPNIFANITKHIFSISKNPNILNPSVDQILISGNLHYAGYWYLTLAIFHKYCEENEPQYAQLIIKKLQEKNAPAYWIQFVISK